MAIYLLNDVAINYFRTVINNHRILQQEKVGSVSVYVYLPDPDSQTMVRQCILIFTFIEEIKNAFVTE